MRPVRAVLLSPPGDLGRIVTRSLASLGADVLLICEPRSSMRFSSLVAQCLLVEPRVFARPDRVRDAILREHEREPIDVVLGAAYPALVLLGAIRDALPCPVFPMASLDLLERLNNKQTFLQLCSEVGIATPPTLYFESHDCPDSHFVARQVGLPCIVKPVDASGGDGVTLVADHAQMPEAIRQVRPHARNGYLVQSFVPGQDVGLSIFAVDGEVRHWATFQCDGFWSTRFANDPPLLAAGRALVRHLGFTGVANFDARRDSRTGELAFFECNPRFFRRVGAARNCGLDFVAAGLAPLGLAAAPPETLTAGRELSARDVFTKQGIALLGAGGYPLRSLGRDLVECLRDPIPSVGSTLHEAAQRMGQFLTYRGQEPG